jgi:hypothetical protein
LLEISRTGSILVEYPFSSFCTPIVLLKNVAAVSEPSLEIDGDQPDAKFATTSSLATT